MSSPKHIFYLKHNTKTFCIDKHLLYDENNIFKWNEIHISQFIIHTKYKKIIINNNCCDYCDSLCISIENFNQNIDDTKKYTLKILDVSNQYIYNNNCTSLICDKAHLFVEKDGKIEFNICITLNDEVIDKYFYRRGEYFSDSTVFEMELFFK